jgi:hypothetical protein
MPYSLSRVVDVEHGVDLFFPMFVKHASSPIPLLVHLSSPFLSLVLPFARLLPSPYPDPPVLDDAHFLRGLLPFYVPTSIFPSVCYLLLYVG